MIHTNTGARPDTRTAEDRLVPVTMEEAVGYPRTEGHQEVSLDELMVLKHDRFFLLLGPHGEARSPGPLGLYFDDTRFLSTYALQFETGSSAMLAAQVPRMYAAEIDLAVTDEAFGGDSWDPKHVIHIHRELLLDRELVERVTLTSYLPEPLQLPVRLDVAADFADIFEVRGWRRRWRGQYYEPLVGSDEIEYRYRGHDGVLVRCGIHFDTPPDELDLRGARWFLRLQPGVRRVLEWRVSPAGLAPPEEHPDQPSVTVEDRRRRMAEEYQDWEGRCSSWLSDVVEFTDALEGAVNDFRALQIEANGTRLVAAGIPWYATIFGRDAIIASLQALPLNPTIAVNTLRYLASRQGRKVDRFTDEEPGKILHEMRRGELARAGEIPHVPYYGTIDATPLWLVLLHETWQWTGDIELVRSLLPAAEACLDWIDEYGDRDGDGFVEYHTRAGKGLRNKGWKDSHDGVPFPDGTLPEGPIALVEVQGYVYDAKRRMADLFDVVGDPARARRLRGEAQLLRERIMDRFWMDGPGTFALALEGEKHLVPTSTSNAGHLLWSGVPDRESGRRLATHLLEPNMFSGWGIRTLSAAHAAYNPMSYHAGSIWPHDNAIIALGLSRYGFDHEALDVLAALHDVAINMRLHRLPELFCGMVRAGGSRPVLYPVSCSPQAWASGAIFMALQGVLGLVPHAPSDVLQVLRPRLPRFLRSLTVSRLQVGNSRVSLRFRRRGDSTQVGVLEVDGAPLQVRVEHS